jgi:hypothetical protein
MQALSQTGLNLTENQKNLLLNTADLNKNGVIDYEEFTRFLMSFQEEPSFPSYEASEMSLVQAKPLSAM